MKAFAAFGAATLAIVLGAGWLLTLAFPTPADLGAIVASAWIAVGVQLVAFAIVRLTLRQNMMAGWGLGALLRLLVFVVYGLVLVEALGLPMTSALISLAVFFFLSTLVEPLLLNL